MHRADVAGIYLQPFRQLAAGKLVHRCVPVPVRWRAPALSLQPVDKTADTRGLILFRQGGLAAISNPKVLLFFGAFLPQFIQPDQPLLAQFIVMAATYAVIEFTVEYLVARVAYKIRPWLERSGKRFNQGCGGLFTLLGASLPLAN